MIDQAAELRLLMGGRPRGQNLMCPSIAITSGKGGVGKTNIAVNLCLAITETGARVTLLDADWGLANADVVLGVKPMRDMRHVLTGACDMEQATCVGPLGLRLVAGASGIAELANLAPHERDRLMSELARLGTQCDMIIIDTAPGINDGVIDLATSVDGTLVVTTPEPTSLTDAYAFVKVALQRHPEARIELIVNMATDRKQAEEVACGFARVTERFLGRSIPLAGFVCTDARVGNAVHRQSPFVLSYPHSVAANCVRRLGQDLLMNYMRPAASPVYKPAVAV